MAETRKLAAILAADVVGFSRLTGADEDRTLARLRALRSDLDQSTTGASSSVPATGRSSSSAAWSTLCVAPLRCRTRWSSAMPATTPTPSSSTSARLGSGPTSSATSSTSSQRPRLDKACVKPFHRFAQPFAPKARIIHRLPRRDDIGCIAAVARPVSPGATTQALSRRTRPVRPGSPSSLAVRPSMAAPSRNS